MYPQMYDLKKAILLFVITGLTKSESTWKQLTGITTPHLHLSVATKKTGEQICSRKYNQRTQQWDMKIVKADKGYEYIPLHIANNFYARIEDVDLFAWHVSLNESDPLCEHQLLPPSHHLPQ